MSNDKLSKPDDSVLKQEQQLSRARARKSQAIASGQKPTKAASSSSADPTRIQSVEQLQQAQVEFETFQKALSAQLSAMQQATAATARQAAEIKHSMPLVFEREFAARDAELRGQSAAGFPVPEFEPFAEFKVTPPQLGAASDAAITGDRATAS